MAYITPEELNLRLGGRIDQAAFPLLSDAIDEACGAIDQHCGQSFTKDDTASARVFRPTDDDCALIDPFWTTDGLVIKVDDDDDGTYEVTWSASDYELVRFGGSRAYVLGAPYDTIRAIGRWFPTCGRRHLTLEVTAKWGWSAVHTNVSAATKILAHDLWKRKDVAFGIQTSAVAEFGGMRIGRDVLAQVAPLLAGFVRHDRTGFA